MKKTTIFIFLLLAILYFPSPFSNFIPIWLASFWRTDPCYTHGFLILVIACVIAWWNVRDYKKSEPEDNPESYKPGIYVFVFGLILYIIGIIKLFPFLSALSFLFTTSGLILYFYGKPLMRTLLFPIAYLIFAIPLPPEFLGKVANTLQTLSSYFPALILEMLGITVTKTGVEIQLEDAAFIIGLPCSGMNSLISLLAIATLFIYILRCPPYKKIILLCITPPLAILANIIRVTSLLLIANAYGAETATGFYHTLFSPLLFIIALIFLILISSLFGCRVTGRAK
jgi:exosortase